MRGGANRHYEIAERLLKEVQAARSVNDPLGDVPTLLAEAQVHATLALRLDK